MNCDPAFNLKVAIDKFGWKIFIPENINSTHSAAFGNGKGIFVARW